MQQQLAQMGNGAHALAIQILGNPDDAADAVNEAFSRALSAQRGYRADKGSVKSWFLQIVRNCCIDVMRKSRPASDLPEALADDRPGPEQVAEAAERDDELRQSLARLQREQREILILRDYMDLSYAEIADVLDIADGTVMSRLHRARMALKQELTRNDA